MRKHKKLFAFIIALILVAIALFGRYEESFRITDVNVQRIEIENLTDSFYADKNLYLVNVDYELNYSYGLRMNHNYNCTRYTANGSVDSLEGIIIEDSSRQSLNKHTEILNQYGVNQYGEKDFNSLQMSFANDSSSRQYIDSYKSWNEIYQVLQRGGPDLHSPNRYCVFYMNKNSPLPKFFTLKFKERKIEVNINNNPIICRVKEVD